MTDVFTASGRNKERFTKVQHTAIKGQQELSIRRISTSLYNGSCWIMLEERLPETNGADRSDERLDATTCSKVETALTVTGLAYERLFTNYFPSYLIARMELTGGVRGGSISQTSSVNTTTLSSFNQTQQ